MKSPDRRYATISDMLMDLKKALVSPNEDFVTIVEASELGKTQVISKITPEQEESITKKAAQALIFDDDFQEEEDEEEYYDDDDYDDDYYDDEDGEDDSRTDKIITIAGIVAGILIVVILVAILGNYLGVFHFNSKKVTMINVVGTDYDAAVEELTDLGLDEDQILPQYEESDEFDDGVVMSQSTKEGEEFSLNDTLRLTVSGQEGSSSSDSSSSSSDSSSSSSSSNESTSSQDNSSSETTTDESDDKTVAVPSVVGLTQAEATTVLDAKNIVVTSTTQDYSDTVPEGQVISQSIEPGEMVAANSTISLVISKGAKETTYKYSIPNPFDAVCAYSFAELNQSGTMPKNGTLEVSNITRSTLTVTLTPIAEDGVTPLNEQAQTLTVNGTAE